MNPDTVFKCILSNPQRAKLAKTTEVEVTIIDDDKPGTFEFKTPTVIASEKDHEAIITVVRKHGADGSVDIRYKTVDGTAQAGKD